MGEAKYTPTASAVHLALNITIHLLLASPQKYIYILPYQSTVSLKAVYIIIARLNKYGQLHVTVLKSYNNL
jgi:hypothetical protein